MTIAPPTPPYDLATLIAIMAQLRNPDGGCPWDLAQDFASIAPYTVEEAYEVADAIARDDMPALADELGDLLLQVVYHSQLAEELGAFSMRDVIIAICDKMVRRHPHVFMTQADAAADGVDVDAVQLGWEARKADERGTAGALDGVALGLPALLRAEKLQRRAARVGFDWPDRSGPLAKIDEELGEYAAAQSAAEREAEFGDVLFSLVNLARHDGIDAESALRAANGRFEARFAAMEAQSTRPMQDQSIGELETLWQQAKRTTRR